METSGDNISFGSPDDVHLDLCRSPAAESVVNESPSMHAAGPTHVVNRLTALRTV